jgi:hypothetical protein
MLSILDEFVLHVGKRQVLLAMKFGDESIVATNSADLHIQTLKQLKDELVRAVPTTFGNHRFPSILCK